MVVVNATDKRYIALTEQTSNRIQVMKAEHSNWDEEQAIFWEWDPNVPGVVPNFQLFWKNPADVKLRWNALHQCFCMLAVYGNGTAMIEYSSQKTRLWTGHVLGNAHAAELLPDGNIAIAASHGHYVRIYTSSQGPDSTEYVEYPLVGGHGVLWEPQKEQLWALGDDELIVLQVAGTAAAPELQLVASYALPTHGGHDLYPVYGKPEWLWVTTVSGVYQFHKPSATWSDSFDHVERIQQSDVKSVGNFPDGDVVLTKPKEGGLYVWTTDEVELVTSTGRETRLKTGAGIYKARVWCADYN